MTEQTRSSARLALYTDAIVNSRWSDGSRVVESRRAAVVIARALVAASRQLAEDEVERLREKIQALESELDIALGDLKEGEW